jgi:hypothetical protein
MSFPITCTACHKTFTISDEIYDKKVAGRVVTIKCKSCNQGIRIDGTKGGEPGAVAATAPAGAASSAPSVPPAAAPPEDPLWAVDYPDGQDREFTTAEVLAELRRETIGAATLVWREGMAEWLELAQVAEFSAELAKLEAKKGEAAAAAAAAASAAAAKPTPVHQPRAPMPTVTGLAGLPGASRLKQTQPSSPDAKARATQPSSPEGLTPRAPQPSTPELPKPRAAQASAPVLAKPPAPPPMGAPTPAAPVAPLPLASLATPPPFVAATLPLPPQATPPLPASVAKVVSRPAQVQPAFPAASPTPMAASFPTGPALIADHATVEWPEAKSKTPLIVVGLVLVAAAIGGAVLLLRGKDDPPPSAPITALPGDLPAAPTTPLTASPTAGAATTQPGSDTATGSDPVSAPRDPGATPGAGFAELFAAGARKAESRGATVAPAARFDPAATKAPLAEAAGQAQACKQSGGPSGKVTVVVTFEPNGKVSSATITDAPFAGTATATCISAALKRATIAPFSGLPGTVSKTFSIL